MAAPQFQYPELPPAPIQNPSIQMIPAPQPSSTQHAQAMQNSQVAAYSQPAYNQPPSQPSPQPTPTVTVALSTITVPPGVTPGQRLNVMMPDGQSVMVVLPDDAQPGQQINVQYQPRGQQQQQTPAVNGLTPPYHHPNHQTPAQHQRQLHATQQFSAFIGRELPVAPISPEHQDREAEKIAWGMYILGWLCCCFCPILAPCLWCASVWMYFCKPQEQRTHMPRQGRVAKCSAATLCMMMAFGFIGTVMMALMHMHHPWHHCQYPCRPAGPHDHLGFPQVHHGPVAVDMGHRNWAYSPGFHYEVHTTDDHHGHWWPNHHDRHAHCVCPQHNGTQTTTSEPEMDHDWVSEDPPFHREHGPKPGFFV